MLLKKQQNTKEVIFYVDVEQERLTKVFLLCLFACLSFWLVIPAEAATTGTDFKAMYDFIYEAATGYLGRGICLFGGLVGLGIAASSGKVIPAIIGVVLAVFGTLGPTIVNNLFNSAII